MTIELTLIGGSEPAGISLPWMAMGRWVDRYLMPWSMAHAVGKDEFDCRDFPRPEDHGTTEWDVEQWQYPDYYHPEGEIPPQVTAYLKELDAFYRYAPEAPGIPVWKLGSNDHWIITPIECRGALVMWEKAGAPFPAGRDDAGWQQFVDLLDRAAEHDGLRVS